MHSVEVEGFIQILRHHFQAFLLLKNEKRKKIVFFVENLMTKHSNKTQRIIFHFTALKFLLSQYLRLLRRNYLLNNNRKSVQKRLLQRFLLQAARNFNPKIVFPHSRKQQKKRKNELLSRKCVWKTFLEEKFTLERCEKNIIKKLNNSSNSNSRKIYCALSAD